MLAPTTMQACTTRNADSHFGALEQPQLQTVNPLNISHGFPPREHLRAGSIPHPNGNPEDIKQFPLETQPPFVYILTKLGGTAFSL